jgi:hypothetical protein
MTEVKELADKIRLAFEEIEIEEGYDNGDLTGFCKRASVQLFLAANERGLPVELVCGSGHVYNLYDGHIIDITATQFGVEDKVWITKIDKCIEFIHPWKPKGDPCNCLEELKNFGWYTSEEEIKGDLEIVRKYLETDNVRESSNVFDL